MTGASFHSGREKTGFVPICWTSIINLTMWIQYIPTLLWCHIVYRSYLMSQYFLFNILNSIVIRQIQWHYRKAYFQKIKHLILCEWTTDTCTTDGCLQWCKSGYWDDTSPLCSISNSKHTAASSGCHGNTQDFVHVRFIKEALYFSKCTGNWKIFTHTLFLPTHLHDQLVTGLRWQRQWQYVIYCVTKEHKRG